MCARIKEWMKFYSIAWCGTEVQGEGKYISYNDISELQGEGNDTVYGEVYQEYELR